MERAIWVMGEDRQEMIAAQRSINATGSMRAICILSFAALARAVEKYPQNAPSLFILDYDMEVEEEFRALAFWKQQQAFAGVPLFFMTSHRERALDEECYSRGATVVLQKPFSRSAILRIERMAWQYEMTRNYEKMLQKQAVDLQTTREIMRLNQQLQTRNELLHQIFGRYFSDEIVEIILEQPKGAAIGGEKREVTIMMADLRGFTALSEELCADAVTALLNCFFDRMVGAITKYHGTVIEFLGDAVLAVFGAPLARDSHTDDAIAAALTMQNALKELRDCGTEEGASLLEMGIGLHRGEAFVGNVGSDRMMRYNVIGRVVNVCSRIESLSLGGQVLISEDTLLAAHSPITTGKRICARVKGVPQPIGLCEVLGISGAYDCQLAVEDKAPMRFSGKGVPVELHPVEGKRVLEQGVFTRLTSASERMAVTPLSASLDEIAQVYGEVEVRILQDGAAESTESVGVYAKLRREQEGCLTLYFTQVTEPFRRFLRECLTEEETR